MLPYRIDPVHTRVLFAVDHAGFSQSLGTFSGATGTLLWDAEDWRSAQLDVTVPLASLDFGDERWQQNVLDRTFLDAGRQPQARFVSTRVEPGLPGQARVFGQLSLRGETREVALDVTMNALKRHPITRRQTAGFSATAELSRSEFGMDAWPNVVGDRIEIRIEAEAIRAPATRPAAALESTDEPQEPR
ncbi:MAG: polyisoprenoid-binding protein [Arenimonas sp.]|nr:polyisoprenoid-binding protein [Arenimonas sp.]